MNNLYGQKVYGKITVKLKKHLDKLVEQYEDEDAKNIIKEIN